MRDLVGLARIVARGMRAIVFLLLPAAAVSVVLAEPIVRLLYQRGEFTASDTEHVSPRWSRSRSGLVVNGLSLLLTRAFYSLQEPRVPTLVAPVNLVLNLVLDIALLRYGAAGIALATAIVTSFNAGMLAVLLRRRVGLAGRRAREVPTASSRVDRGGDDLLHRRGVRGVVPAGQARWAGSIAGSVRVAVRPGAGPPAASPILVARPVRMRSGRGGHPAPSLLHRRRRSRAT